MRKVKTEKVVTKEFEEEDGLIKLMGEQVWVWCVNYIYTGKLIGVNDTCILLEDAGIVFETGDLTKNGFRDHQRLQHPVYVQIAAIESFSQVSE